MLQHKNDETGAGGGQAIAINRLDYTAPAYWIDTVDLTFDLDPAKTRVLNKMHVRRNTAVDAQPLKLDGAKQIRSVLMVFTQPKMKGFLF